MTQEYVLGFLFDPHGNSVVLINKIKPDWQFGFLNGVGGKIEEGEDKHEAMVREFNEETGVFIPQEDWEYVGVMTGKDWIVYCFKTFNNKIQDIQTMTEEEVGIYSVWTLHKRNLLTNILWLVHFCLDKIPYQFNVEYKT